MRTKLVAVSAGITTEVVSQSECPAKVVFANVGAGTVYFSNEGNAHSTGAGIPVGLNAITPWGETTRPLFAFCIGEPTEILVTFLEKDDEITVS